MNLPEKPSQLSRLDPRKDEDIQLAHRLARKVCRDPSLAEDIAQSVLANLVRMAGDIGFLEIEKPAAYLHRALRNELNQHFRKTGSGKGVSFDEETFHAEISSAGPDPEQTALLKERKLILSEVMRELTEDENKILYLLTLNYKPNEIALRLGISHEHARVKIHRLKAALEKKIRARLR